MTCQLLAIIASLVVVGGWPRLVLIGPQMLLQERPCTIPGISLLGRVLSFECVRVYAPAECMTDTRTTGCRIHVDLGFSQLWFLCAQRPDQHLRFLEVH